MFFEGLKRLTMTTFAASRSAGIVSVVSVRVYSLSASARPFDVTLTSVTASPFEDEVEHLVVRFGIGRTSIVDVTELLSGSRSNSR